MDMKLRIVSAFIVALPCAGVLQAADQQLLNLVMPDAKILAGVNVSQARTSPFGQFVISQLQGQDQRLSDVIAKTGFDPRRDLEELLIASNGAQSNASHLTLARGTFNADQIDAAATAGGATSEVYNGITIVENVKHGQAFAFLSATLAPCRSACSYAVAGGLADVKGAIDRQTAPATVDAGLLVAANKLSTSEDAWAVSSVPPPEIKPPANAPNVPAIPSTVFQNVERAQGGVKFGPANAPGDVVLNAVLEADTAQNATALANVLQFLVNLGQMQAPQGSQATVALKSVNISASGKTVTVSGAIPETQLEALIQSKAQPNVERPNVPRRQRRL
jgi:hypothetical protein